MQTRRLTEQDLPMLFSWWKAWGWEQMPPDGFLSDDGILVTNGDDCICAGFLYKISNADVAWFTFPVSNPEIRGVERKDGIRLMIDTIVGIAKDLGYKYVYSSLRNSSMIQAQKNCGFIEADNNHTELLKYIWEQD